MGLLIVKTDFTGKYKISQNTYSAIDSYIAKYEELYLIQLLGADLFALFKADVVNYLPQTAKYLTIYNKITKDDGNYIRVSEGMKEMILGFIYFEFMRDDKFKSTPSGVIAGQSENSRETAFEENNIYSRYNTSIKSYKTIQWYIEQNSSVYPEYNGQDKGFSSWI